MSALSQDLLTRHTPPVAQFLNSNYERFFDGYTELLQSENYVTRRQSLKVRSVELRMRRVQSSRQVSIQRSRCLYTGLIFAADVTDFAPPGQCCWPPYRVRCPRPGSSPSATCWLTAAPDRHARGSQLLGEILLHRANVKAMMRYVSEVNNLKLMMVLLKDQSRSIQFEAFHVFKARSLP